MVLQVLQQKVEHEEDLQDPGRSRVDNQGNQAVMSAEFIRVCAICPALREVSLP